MEIERFLEERRERWDRLGQLLDLVDRTSARSVGPERVQELLRLYREACSDLNRARSMTANPELIGRLNELTGRGYRFVYRGGRRPLDWRAVRRYLTDDVPAAFRREVGHVLAATATFFLGALFGFLAVEVDRENGRYLIPEIFFTESPRERVEQIEQNPERIGNVDTAAAFGSQLYTHNIKVTFLAFSLGAATILLGWWILFYNGTILGAVMAMYLQDDVGTFFFAWVGPHGALELPAIIFAGAAGLRMGSALFFPGSRSRGASVRHALPSIWRIMTASAILLVAAGLIEGSFSQFSSKTVPYSIKIAVAVCLFAGLVGWLYLKPIGRARTVAS